MKTKTQRVFEVTIVQNIDDVIEATGIIQGSTAVSHMNREPISALTADAARSKAERKLTKKMTDAAADLFIDSLEVKVEAVNFY